MEHTETHEQRVARLTKACDEALARETPEQRAARLDEEYRQAARDGSLYE
jgi:hypothetical protein